MQGSCSFQARLAHLASLSRERAAPDDLSSGAACVESNVALLSEENGVDRVSRVSDVAYINPSVLPHAVDSLADPLGVERNLDSVEDVFVGERVDSGGANTPGSSPHPAAEKQRLDSAIGMDLDPYPDERSLETLDEDDILEPAPPYSPSNHDDHSPLDTTDDDAEYSDEYLYESEDDDDIDLFLTSSFVDDATHHYTHSPYSCIVDTLDVELFDEQFESSGVALKVLQDSLKRGWSDGDEGEDVLKRVKVVI